MSDPIKAIVRAVPATVDRLIGSVSPSDADALARDLMTWHDAYSLPAHVSRGDPRIVESLRDLSERVVRHIDFDQLAESAGAPPRAIDDLRERLANHFASVGLACIGRPADDTARLVRRVTVLQCYLEWAYFWNLLTKPRGVAMLVHACFGTNRLGWPTESGPDLPRDEAMSPTHAVSELDRLRRHLVGRMARPARSDPFYTARWFKRNTRVRSDALRDAKRRGKIRTAAEGSQVTYSLADATRLWPDRAETRQENSGAKP